MNLIWTVAVFVCLNCASLFAEHSLANCTEILDEMAGVSNDSAAAGAETAEMLIQSARSQAAPREEGDEGDSPSGEPPAELPDRDPWGFTGGPSNEVLNAAKVKLLQFLKNRFGNSRDSGPIRPFKTELKAATKIIRRIAIGLRPPQQYNLMIQSRLQAEKKLLEDEQEAFSIAAAKLERSRPYVPPAIRKLTEALKESHNIQEQGIGVNRKKILEPLAAVVESNSDKALEVTEPEMEVDIRQARLFMIVIELVAEGLIDLENPQIRDAVDELTFIVLQEKTRCLGEASLKTLRNLTEKRLPNFPSDKAQRMKEVLEDLSLWQDEFAEKVEEFVRDFPASHFLWEDVLQRFAAIHTTNALSAWSFVVKLCWVQSLSTRPSLRNVALLHAFHQGTLVDPFSGAKISLEGKTPAQIARLPEKDLDPILLRLLLSSRRLTQIYDPLVAIRQMKREVDDGLKRFQRKNRKLQKEISDAAQQARSGWERTVENFIRLVVGQGKNATGFLPARYALYAKTVLQGLESILPTTNQPKPPEEDEESKTPPPPLFVDLWRLFDSETVPLPVKWGRKRRSDWISDLRSTLPDADSPEDRERFGTLAIPARDQVMIDRLMGVWENEAMDIEAERAEERKRALNAIESEDPDTIAKLDQRVQELQSAVNCILGKLRVSSLQRPIVPEYVLANWLLGYPHVFAFTLNSDHPLLLSLQSELHYVFSAMGVPKPKEQEVVEAAPPPPNKLKQIMRKTGRAVLIAGVIIVVTHIVHQFLDFVPSGWDFLVGLWNWLSGFF